MLLSLTFNNPMSLLISFLVLLFFISDVVAGYKKGFLESTLKFVKSIIAMIIAYLFKGPLSSYLYLNFPFFNLDGVFKGVTAVNILIYEIIAFVVLFIIVSIILTIIFRMFKIEEHLFRLVSIIGVPNKIMGAILGGLKSIVLLYFVLSLFFVGSNFMEWDTGESLGNYIVEIPLLKNTFGNVLDSFDEITELAVDYENIQDKEELNNDAINILLEYDIISEENLELLIESGKIEYSVNNVEEQKEMVENLYEAFNEGR